MRHQRLADGAAVAMQHREHPLRQTAVGNRGLNGAADQFGRAGMGAVRLDHHRAACSQGGRGVSARHGKRQREIAGAEDGNRSERNLAQAQVGAGRRAVRQRRVQRGIEPAAVAHDLGEQAQLAHGATAFAFQPGLRQA